MTSADLPHAPHWCVLGRDGDGYALVVLNAEQHTTQATPRRTVTAAEVPALVASLESEGRAAGATPRWVWHDTATIYPLLLAAGVRVERCHDLRLCHQILRRSALVTEPAALRGATAWDVAPELPQEPTEANSVAPALFEIESPRRRRGAPPELAEALTEFERQRAAVATASEPGRLALLLAAESAGALIAAELTAAGVPWDVERHDQLLTDALGPRPIAGELPLKMQAISEEVRRTLGDPAASLDSQPKLLRSLRAAGIEVASTSRWELAEHTHPAIEPLLHYKKLSRLLSANGWAWIDEWVTEGRYRPVYVPGGVVTGRWASSGGGALQLPRQLRPALRADAGWLLVSADVSQLEPRVLAAMSGDRAMAAAGAGKDLYAGIVESGAVATRQEAKIAVLGAMYGSTTGDAGRLVPRLRRAFPAAMHVVDEAAAAGERGERVSTWLGRTSPGPSADWLSIQSAASLPEATRRDEDLARRAARDRGRFTRNFIVQGTAAEWALAWLADLRLRLSAFPPVLSGSLAHASGPVFARHPHLAFFLHDEVIVHTPREHAEAVAVEIEAAARTAGQRLFGAAPVDFRLDVRISERAEKE